MRLLFIDGKELISVSDVASLEGVDYVLLYGQFLDDYTRSDAKEKALLISRPPFCNPDRPEYYVALLAAVCETLAKQDDLPIPGWVYERRCYLEQPVFAFNTTVPGHREYLLETTPEEFMSRNVIFGDTVLSRC